MSAMLYCNSGYISAGSTTTFCDGILWDREIGTCRKDAGFTKECDFETKNMCGWVQDESENDFSWVRKNGWRSFERLEYGPKYDHTVNT